MQQSRVNTNTFTVHFTVFFKNDTAEFKHWVGATVFTNVGLSEDLSIRPVEVGLANLWTF